MKKLARDFVPKPKIVHPWPAARFAATHPGRTAVTSAAILSVMALFPWSYYKRSAGPMAERASLELSARPAS